MLGISHLHTNAPPVCVACQRHPHGYIARVSEPCVGERFVVITCRTSFVRHHRKQPEILANLDRVHTATANHAQHRILSNGRCSNVFGIANIPKKRILNEHRNFIPISFSNAFFAVDHRSSNQKPVPLLRSPHQHRKASWAKAS